MYQRHIQTGDLARLGEIHLKSVRWGNIFFGTRPTRAAKAGSKSSLLFESPSDSVSTVSRGHSSLVSLICTVMLKFCNLNEIQKVIMLLKISNDEKHIFYELPHLITSSLKRNSVYMTSVRILRIFLNINVKNTWFSYRLNLNVTIDGFVGENVLPG